MFWSFVQLYRPNQFQTLAFADFMVLDKIIKKREKIEVFPFWSFFERNEKPPEALYVSNEVIFHFRNSHRQSTRKRWQNRSRRNWAQMASSANNAMQKGKNFNQTSSKIILAERLVESSLQRSVTSLFSHRFLLIMQKKKTYNYGRFTNSIWHFADWI